MSPIQSRLKILIAEKELRENRRLTFRTISSETGISTSTLIKYANRKIDRFDAVTLDGLCRYFNCQPGDILTFKNE